ncbi:MAG TPA: alpha-amylase, partial [Flavobacterium sp.]
MKKQNFKIYLLSALLVGFYSCSPNDAVVTDSPATASQFKIINVTHHDGHPFSTGKTSSSLTGKYVANPGGGVMMQAFYWDVPSGGTWWNTVNAKVTEWSNAGIGSLWLPPVSKAQNGAFS